ncbi:hypothetical protein MCAP1_003084 [Malassezia caprae]|uniref:Sodium/calcium exchanger membrane region domain-containing protein n=1 Tax=Malassezia caprae TaxID=1381934 RepID=A0AAF0J1A9_9BASI|nr:hypothetical protein MCAP1_003084 [Malassezia caprae]
MAERGVWWALARAAPADSLGGACAPLPPGISASEACAFVRAQCADSPLYAYVQAYYCLGTGSGAMVGRAFVSCALFVWLLVLFSALGLVASDFFCPNLALIATRLGLSDSVVGVTLLALGNGFPDVISTFRAMEKNAGALALGELMGAAVFTVSMVCGSIMLMHEFAVPPASFLRDVGTYTVAVLLVLFFLLDGSLGLGEGMCMLGLYLGYVATVCLGDLASPHDEASAPLLDRPMDIEAPSTPQLGHHSLLSAARVHDLSRLGENGLAMSCDMAYHVLDPMYGVRHPSLYRARSFHSTERHARPLPPRRPGRSRTVDAIRPAVPAAARMADETPSPIEGAMPALPSPRVSLVDSPVPSIHEDVPVLPVMEEVLAHLRSPSEALTLTRLLVIAFVPSLLRWEQKSHFHRGVSVFCAPAFLALRLTVPLVSHDEFLLHEALCRVREAAEDADEERALWDDIWDEVGAVLETPAPIVHTAERVAADHLLLCVNCVMSPLFVLWVAEAPAFALAATGVLGSVAGAVLWRHLRRAADRDAPSQLQLYALWRSALGFGLGLMWIVVLVDGVLALLRAFGYLYHWSEAILGLTLFALGNSLGDVVTNLSIARLGHPIMALTACFASPMTNLLLGIGFSATWLSLRYPTHGPHQIALSPALVLSSSVLLLMLVLMLVVLPLLRFRVNRYLGMCLLATYVGVMGANIVLELHADARLV